MPRHVWMMWLLAGGGTLVGASLTYLATRPVLAPATTHIHAGWRRIREVLPAIFKFRSGESVSPRRIMRSTGSSAFDEYRAAQIETLEREAQEFSDFLRRLRDARDREEFDTFIRDKKAGRIESPITIDNE
jgi:hypothetical protein